MTALTPPPSRMSLGTPASLAHLLPHPIADCPNARIALFAIRRLGAHGLADATAVQAMLNAFGQGFRRPLMLARTLMVDLATTSSGPIAIAPCCCARMTPAERGLLAVLQSAETRPERARLLLEDVLGNRRVDGVLASAAALASAFADAGRPIG